MARDHDGTTGWVDTIPLESVVTDDLEPLRAGQKMNLLGDPTG